jgi:uncharacterized protein (TIGR03437 family)
VNTRFLRFLTLLAALGATPVFAQTLTPTPASLTFTYQSGNTTLPAAQTLAIRISTGKPAYVVSTTPASVPWLTVSPDSGTMPASLSVRVNPTTLAVNIYTATVDVTVTGIAAPVSVPVTLTVTSPLPSLTLSANVLTFESPATVSPQTVVLNTTGSPISFTAVAGATWLGVTPTSGVILLGAPITLTVSVDTSSLTPKSTAYIGKITVNATGAATASKTQSITVSLLVDAATPTITSIWPSTVLIGSPSTTVTIRGTGFYAPGTTVSIQGVTTPLTTTVFSSTALMAVIPATQLANAATLNLVVSNPAPGGDSAPSPFVVTATPIVAAAVSVASNLGPAVSPGELINIYGQSIGPATPATLTSTTVPGFVDTTLNGVAVTIDSVPAPLLYVSENQIAAQVPYEVSIGTAKNIVVNNGVSVANGTVDIAAEAPGLFTLDATGSGQAAALNYDPSTAAYTVNASNNPAKVGDTLLLYATGEGDYATSVFPRTGLIIPSSLSPLPELATMPTVTFGTGATALNVTAAYAGPSVGSIMGLLQINVQIPAGVPTGGGVPVSVNINGMSTQTGVTISLHQ